MVVDSSAIVAIALQEPYWEELFDQILSSTAIVSAVTMLEVHIVLRSRLGDDANRVIELILGELKIEIVPFGPDHYRSASKAYDRFGKGRHPAALNFGDCISYALHDVSRQPLLFIGNDFDKTDALRTRSLLSDT